MTARRKVLVVGSGGREHALAHRLLESESVGEVLVAPGNAGTDRTPRTFPDKVLRNVAGSPLEIAERERVDLVVVGPEAPLCAGLADELSARKIRVFGPSRRAAQLEGSKAFMKDFAARHGLPTARHEVVRDLAGAERAVASFSTPPVVKADGLASGKGVVVAESHDEALAALRVMLSGERFGDAGKTVVLEERLPGAELSVHAVCDGERFVLLAAAQDHKRLADGDRGPNTGGMGTYAPAPLASEALLERVRRDIIAPAVRGMAADGNPYVGSLFAGLMVTPAGDPMLLEFNVRFGDPETQVLMQTLRGDFAEALAGAASGTLDPLALESSGEHAVCVVLAAHGYPEAPRTGDTIEGLERAEAFEGVRVFHAGTRRAEQRVESAGGRVLGVTAVGATLAGAHARAYAAVEQIRFAGMQFRRDIAARALAGSSR
ncbi:MAG TPA: phosphoribosylamine--glycine ligase [Polyangiaceae bacterium]